MVNLSSSVGNANPASSIFVTRMERIALVVSVAASIFILIHVLRACRSGFDFTDEGFYLNLISNPWLYRASLSQFGFVYHPLYEIVGENVVLLRQANVLIVFALGSTLAFTLMKSVFVQCGPISTSLRMHLVGVALVVGAASLSLFHVWLPTPNYNSDTFQSLVLAATGALLASREPSKTSYAGWILVGIGGGMAFLAKPTTAAMLACMMAGYLTASGKMRLREVSISVMVAILFLAFSALVIDGSVIGFVHRIMDGVTSSNQLSTDHELARMFRLDSFRFSRKEIIYFGIILIVSFAISKFVESKNHAVRLFLTMVTGVCAMLSVAIVEGVLHPTASYAPFMPLQFWAIAFGIAIAAVTFPIRGFQLLNRNELALVVFFAILPYAYAFGTGNNYWAQSACAGLFWLMAGFVVSAKLAATELAWRKSLPIAAAALLVPAVVLNASMDYPYRQPQPLALQTSAVDINHGKTKLFVAEQTASYVQDLVRLSTESGFGAGDYMLDLTGESPGSLYVIGAKSLGVAWTLGGYPNSNQFVKVALSQEACRAIGASWILTEPDGPNPISAAVLSDSGVNFSKDYLDVASTGPIRSMRSYAPQKFEYHLLKPTRSIDVAASACEAARNKKPGVAP